jgi:sporulation protein YlmC with PRC-barrel domain
MKTACALQLESVRTEDGRRIGKVFDMRCEWRGAKAEITHLVYGRRGLWERLGFRHPRQDTLPWSSIVRIEERVVIVSNDLVSR